MAFDASWKTAAFGAAVTSAAGFLVEALSAKLDADSASVDALWIAFGVVFFAQGLILVAGRQVFRAIFWLDRRVSLSETIVGFWTRMLIWFVCAVAIIVVINLSAAM